MLSALNVHYRDVKYAVPFFIQMALFLTPVLYPIDHVPGRLRFLLSINPMAGMVEGFRYALLGGSVSWQSNGGLIIVWGHRDVRAIGLFFIRRMENYI